MADERFEMSVKAIRARYESWREFCETDDARVASDFWRDIGFLLSRLGECEEALRSSDAAHAEVVDENQQLLSRLRRIQELTNGLRPGIDERQLLHDIHAVCTNPNDISSGLVDGETAEQDAARYRWLKTNHLQLGPDCWIRTGEDLDEAIDAELSKADGEERGNKA